MCVCACVRVVICAAPSPLSNDRCIKYLFLSIYFEHICWRVEDGGRGGVSFLPIKVALLLCDDDDDDDDDDEMVRMRMMTEKETIRERKKMALLCSLRNPARGR